MSWRVSLRAWIGALDLDVELEGESGVVALMGPNGAGKTSVLRAIAGASAGATGTIAIDRDVLFDSSRAIDRAPEERRVGNVPQGFGLFPHLSALENVSFGLRGRSGARRIALDMLDRLGCIALEDRSPAALSGGEKQKVALARALVLEPRMLLLDEPMAALDVAARRRMRSFLRELLAERGVPAILVTHDPRDAIALAGDVFVLTDGTIVQRGSPSELAAAPATELVAELFGEHASSATAQPAR